MRLSYNLFSWCCFNNYKSLGGLFGDRLLKIQSAPDPSNINWRNLNYSKLSKFIRRGISIIITILILVVSFVGLLYLNAQKI